MSKFKAGDLVFEIKTNGEIALSKIATSERHGLIATDSAAYNPQGINEQLVGGSNDNL